MADWAHSAGSLISHTPGGTSTITELTVLMYQMNYTGPYIPSSESFMVMSAVVTSKHNANSKCRTRVRQVTGPDVSRGRCIVHLLPAEPRSIQLAQLSLYSFDLFIFYSFSPTSYIFWFSAACLSQVLPCFMRWFHTVDKMSK